MAASRTGLIDGGRDRSHGKRFPAPVIGRPRARCGGLRRASVRALGGEPQGKLRDEQCGQVLAEDADGLFPRMAEGSPFEILGEEHVIIAVGKGEMRHGSPSTACRWGQNQYAGCCQSRATRGMPAGNAVVIADSTCSLNASSSAAKAPARSDTALRSNVTEPGGSLIAGQVPGLIPGRKWKRSANGVQNRE